MEKSMPRVLHLADVDDRRSGDAGRRRAVAGRTAGCSVSRWYTSRTTLILPSNSTMSAPMFDGCVLLPLQVRVARATSAGIPPTTLVLVRQHVVVRVAAAAAELRDDASRRNELVSGDAPAEPQHGVGEDAVVRQERLVGDSPSQAEGRERSPAGYRAPGGTNRPSGP